ncbi:MAG: arylsulfatase [Bryobacterales bacterium]|nr:arylsulfatase [Bryobacterales bacterium]
MADDLGYGDLGCYNRDSKVPTPHLDRLASQGMRFTDAHSPSAVCTPTRYGLMTGRYCWRTHLKEGVLWGYSPNLIEPGRMTVASLLKRHGYATAVIGKWHLGLGDAEKTDYAKPLRPGPLDHGFDTFFGIPASLDMEPYVWVIDDRVERAPTATTPGRDEPRGVFWRGGPIAPDFEMEEVLPRLTSRAVEYLEGRARERDKPFFLYFPLPAPHTPWFPLDQYRGKSGAGDYGDFVTQVDESVGRVLRALDDLKLAGDTLFIFTSDNGAHWRPDDIEKWGHRANAPLRGQKADIWEGGHRIPFLARWPGRIRPGAASSEVTCLTDLLATAAAIVGAKLPDNAAEDSYNILPALEGKRGKPIREAVVHHSVSGMFSIRKGNWKLIEGLGSGGFSDPRTVEPKPGEAPGALYDLSRDLAETNNLYASRPDVVKELRALLERYKRQGYSRPRG